MKIVVKFVVFGTVLIVASAAGSLIGYGAGRAIGTAQPDYITRHFVPLRYINEDGSVQETSFWGFPGVYRPEKLGGEVGAFQGAVAGFWIGAISLVATLFYERRRRTNELENKIEELERLLSMKSKNEDI